MMAQTLRPPASLEPNVAPMAVVTTGAGKSLWIPMQRLTRAAALG